MTFPNIRAGDEISILGPPTERGRRVLFRTVDDLEPWEREGYSREEVGKPVACMFCGMEVAWRDVDPLWVTIESAPEAQRGRDVGRLGAIGWTMYAHTVCLVERLDSPPPFLGAAIKRIRPPGTP